jgi:hypothetical protein
MVYEQYGSFPTQFAQSNVRVSVYQCPVASDE